MHADQGGLYLREMGNSFKDTALSLRHRFVQAALDVKRNPAPLNIARNAACAGIDTAMHTLVALPAEAVHHAAARMMDIADDEKKSPRLFAAADALGVFNMCVMTTLVHGIGFLSQRMGIERPEAPAKEEPVPPTQRSVQF